MAKPLKFITAFALMFLLTVTVFTVPGVALAQTTVNCGDTVQGEFTASEQLVTYLITLQPGTQLRAQASRFGDYLQFYNSSHSGYSRIVAPSGQTVSIESEGTVPNLQMTTGVLGERGTYRIDLLNQIATGSFTLRISCTLPDGKIVDGDTTPPVATPQPGDALPPNTTPPPFSGRGFPGLAPVDFAQVAQIPLTIGTPITGAVTPTGGEILGYVFDGKANAPITLTVTRLSGNLNLGVVVLSEDNKVVYQASFVTSSEMSTTFTLPSDGKYTVGIFHINLISPTTPEPTAFQIQIK